MQTENVGPNQVTKHHEAVVNSELDYVSIPILNNTDAMSIYLKGLIFETSLSYQFVCPGSAL